ncbi:hypothetical protein BTUL_0064g00150 [Botrytis tulipae]|uniref:Uncharacterized protein n=1 Tax=Botrytis tulipae TaxID=87230 RepID=A0A4Z1EMY1_9HELO|nr:hypothetical protein BTUL_0064g00150 [Botrytis tulipae]
MATKPVSKQHGMIRCGRAAASGHARRAYKVVQIIQLETGIPAESFEASEGFSLEPHSFVLSTGGK